MILAIFSAYIPFNFIGEASFNLKGVISDLLNKIMVGDCGSTLVKLVIIFLIVAAILCAIGLNEMDRVKKMMKKFQEKDKNFSEQIFLSKGRTLYHEIKRALSRQNLESVKSYVTPDLFRRLDLQIGDSKEKGLVRKLSDINITSFTVLDLGVEGPYDFIKVSSYATMTEEILTKGQCEGAGEKKEITVSENWVFIRKMGVITEEDSSAHSNCPNCSAPLGDISADRCPYCDTLISGGNFGWVVSSIEP